jgi:hypothetical protein
MKNGNSEGKTTSHHIAIPFNEASRASLGKMIKDKAIKVDAPASSHVFRIGTPIPP